MKRLLLITTFILPTSAMAQPFSESMADCAAIYQNAAQWVETDEAADKLMYAAVSWADAAVAQSRSEGRAQTVESMWDKIDSKTQEWERKGQLVFFSQDFRDWTQYCRKFAKSQNIRIEP